MSIAQLLVNAAKSELADWKAGQLVECVKDPETKKPINNPAAQPGSKKVAKYWRDGLGDHQRNGCTDVAWSAAFICWCLRQAGVPLDRFPFSAGHHTYIRWAINNSKADKAGKLYYGMRIAEYQPKPGDLVAQWRKAKPGGPDPNISYDHQPDDFYPSHCDIVVDVQPNRITLIGGNLSNRVKESRLLAQDRILEPKKELVAVLKLVDDA
jgi:hypothetical protein